MPIFLPHTLLPRFCHLLLHHPCCLSIYYPWPSPDRVYPGLIEISAFMHRMDNCWDGISSYSHRGHDLYDIPPTCPSFLPFFSFLSSQSSFIAESTVHDHQVHCGKVVLLLAARAGRQAAIATRDTHSAVRAVLLGHLWRQRTFLDPYICYKLYLSSFGLPLIGCFLTTTHSLPSKYSLVSSQFNPYLVLQTPKPPPSKRQKMPPKRFAQSVRLRSHSYSTTPTFAACAR